MNTNFILTEIDMAEGSFLQVISELAIVIQVIHTYFSISSYNIAIPGLSLETADARKRHRSNHDEKKSNKY